VQRSGPSTGMPTRTQQSDIMTCAYASHGDTKHVLLIPDDPHECFEFGATSLDLADRLQTPVFVMLDLEIGMNERLTAPLTWDDSRRMDRGKVMTAEELEAGRVFGRYLDVDGDAVPYRTYPGTHPTKGSYFTRGTSRDEFARYTEAGDAYQRNMERLLKKWDTAKTLVPKAIRKDAGRATKYGVIFYGSTSPAIPEAAEILEHQSGIVLDQLRIRAFPFGPEVEEFIDQHETVFVVEQNRDAQMRTLLINELETNPKKLVRVLHYDGAPVTAEFIAGHIGAQITPAPVREAAE